MHSDLSHRDLLVALVRIATNFNHELPSAAAFIVAASVDTQRHRELPDIYVKQAERISTALITIIERGQAAGLTPERIDPVEMARLMRAVVFGFSQLAVITSVAESEAVIDLFESEFLAARD